MRRKFRLVCVIILVVAGVAVMVYPTLSSYINTLHSSRAVQELSQKMQQTDSQVLKHHRALAEQYNEALTGGGGEILGQYGQVLEFGNGIMGSISIPKIGVELSIYHGVSEAVLQKGVGHLPGSALPIGGAGNHSVLTGHTGLPGAELFTDLTELQLGDVFYIHVLDGMLGYEVDEITVVLPHEVESLGAAAGRDYCTLVTCTPYGINSHRLLVRGERIPGSALPAEEDAAAGEIRIPVPGELILAGIAAAVLLATAAVILLRKDREGSP